MIEYCTDREVEEHDTADLFDMLALEAAIQEGASFAAREKERLPIGYKKFIEISSSVTQTANPLPVVFGRALCERTICS